MHSVLQERYDTGLTDKYLVQTQLQTKSSEKKLLEVHGVKNNLNPNSLPEKQKIAPPLIKVLKLSQD